MGLYPLLIFGMLLAGASEPCVQSASNGYPALLEMISPEKGVLWWIEDTDGCALLLDISSLEVAKISDCYRLAVNKRYGTMLLAPPGGGSLVLYDLSKSPPAIIARRKNPLRYCWIRPANFKPDYQYCVIGWTERNSESALFCMRLVGPFSLPKRMGARRHDVATLSFEPLPVLSDMVTLMSSLSPLFCLSRPATFAANCHVSMAALQILPRSLGFGRRFTDPLLRILNDGIPTSWFIIVTEGKIRRAYPATGLTSSYPIAFSLDGRRLLANIFVPGSDRSLWLVDMDTGKREPYGLVPEEYQQDGLFPLYERILAVSDDLGAVLLRTREGLMLATGKAPAKQVTGVPEGRTLVADYMAGKFFATDGETLWEISIDGRIGARKIHIAGSRCKGLHW